MVPGKNYIGVGCGAFILNEKKELLLQLRNKAPEKEYWSIPGGKVEMFETFEDAVKREIKEEVGVEIEVGELIGICDHIIKAEEKHWVSPSYLCRIVNGEPRIMEPTKHLDMQWFALDQLPEKLTITTQFAIQKYQELTESLWKKSRKIGQW